MEITLLAETEDYAPVTLDDLGRWVDRHELTHPVLADPDWAISHRFMTSAVVDLPSMHLIAPGGEVLRVEDHISRFEIESFLAAYQ